MLKRKKFYKRLEPAIAYLEADRADAKTNIPKFEQKGGMWLKEARGNRRDVKSMDAALEVLRKQ